MGKKGNWFAVLKRAFTSSPKEKPVIVSEQKYVKEKKKWGLGRARHGEVNSFIPLYREPSSIEKILGDAERETKHRIHQEKLGDAERETKHRIQQEKLGDADRETKHRIQKEKLGDAERETKYRIHQETSKKKVQQYRTPAPKPIIASNKRIINTNYAQISAIKIQAAYRGYMARKSYQALKGLVRLQRVMRGQSVKRQTTNTMRCMQLLVKVQSQVRARRLQAMDGRSLQQHHTPRRSDNKEIESSLGRWSLAPQSDAGTSDEWDDSVLTKEERDARIQRKVEAVAKRERALAYAYSHQLLKVTPKSAHAVLTDVRSGGFPWWWNWLDRQLPHEAHHPSPQPHHPSPQPHHPSPRPKTLATPIPKPAAATSTPRLRPISRGAPMFDASTPRSAKPLSSNRWQRAPLKRAADDESLTSCPAYTTVPNYMAPTVSAKAKVRAQTTTSGDRHDSKRRFSFSLTQSIGSLFSVKDVKEPLPRRMPAGKHKSTSSIGGLSVDSTVSLPVGVGKKPFR